MNWDIIEGNWKQLKGQIRQQWAKLSDDDIDLIEGKREVLAGKLQEKYGYAKDEANRQIDVWSRELKDAGSDVFGEQGLAGNRRGNLGGGGGQGVL